MKIHRLARADPKEVDLFLQSERERRFFSSERQKLDDLLLVYEPTEAFSIHRETDIKSVRKETEDDFWAYAVEKAVPIIKTKRGGGMIWHGPGQVCLAPLVDLERIRLNITNYSNILEETCIETLNYFGVSALRNHFMAGSQGAWVEERDGIKRKLAFFGWSDARGIAIHGCAINVSPDLYPFSLIDPCNLRSAEVSSMERFLLNKLNAEEVGKTAAEIFIKLLYK